MQEERHGAPDVTFRRVTKRFEEVVAIDAIDLEVRKGEFLALARALGLRENDVGAPVTT